MGGGRAAAGGAPAVEEEEETCSLLGSEALIDQLFEASLRSQQKSTEVAQLLQEDRNSLQKSLARSDATKAKMLTAALAIRKLESGRRGHRLILLGIIAFLFLLDSALVYLKLIR